MKAVGCCLQFFFLFFSVSRRDIFMCIVNDSTQSGTPMILFTFYAFKGVSNTDMS